MDQTGAGTSGVDTFGQELFSGASGKARGGSGGGRVGELDMVALKRAADEVRGKLTPAGQASQDEANAVFARIANLFPGVDRYVIDLSLFSWGALNGTGSGTDYGNSPDIEAGGIKIPATKVFGGIIPVDGRGMPRRIFSAYFEKNVKAYLEVLPELAPMLTARAAKMGNPGAAPLQLLDFVKGVTPGTAGGAAERQHGKDALIRKRQVARGAVVGSAPTVDLGGPATTGGGGGQLSHSLY